MSKRPNIVLIVLDTLRAQNMSCYGYPCNTTPAMDEYANKGVLFNYAFANVIPTQPSHTAILTGTNPNTNNIVSHFLLKDCLGGWREIAPKLTLGVKLVSQLMQEKGYMTCAVDNLTMMRSYFRRGYDNYLYSSLAEGVDKLIRVTADEINAKLFPLLEEIKDKTFFLFVHYWDPHGPYVPPKEFQKFMKSKKEKEKMEREMVVRGVNLSWQDFVPSESPGEDKETMSKYDGEVAYVDDRLRQVFTKLCQLGLEKETIVIITADHGEEFGTHNVRGHAGLHDQQIRIPLILYGPGCLPSGKKIDNFASHIDIVPTILDYAGIEFKEDYPLSGTSLKPIIEGKREEADDIIYSVECTQQKTRAIRTKKWKFIKAVGDEPRSDQLPPKELYDLANDPLEERNLIDAEIDIARKLEAKMDERIKKECQRAGRKEDIALITPIGTQVWKYRDRDL